MAKILSFFRVIGLFFVNLFRNKGVNQTVNKKIVSEEPIEVDPLEGVVFLKPLKHQRYISIYCIADLTNGDNNILTMEGEVIWGISDRSLKRLVMEGTGRLSNGKVVNVDDTVNGVWRYKVMGGDSPHGVGIKGEPLVPWISLAHHYGQLSTYDLFNREVIIPSLKGYELPDGTLHNGRLKIHDTGGGLRSCPYNSGLWRTGATKSEYGQFDLFIGGPESVYNSLLSTWNSYREVIVMPRDTSSNKGVQETLNLLMDVGLEVDGLIGPKTKKAICGFQKTTGIKCTGEWDELTKMVAEKSLDRWDEGL